MHYYFALEAQAFALSFCFGGSSLLILKILLEARASKRIIMLNEEAGALLLLASLVTCHSRATRKRLSSHREASSDCI
jgi:hypothetical protein